MYKVLIFNKRRAGLSHEEFVKYYESVHAKRAEKYLVNVKRYCRRYIEWRPARNDSNPDLGFDVITEMWCDTREDFEAAIAAVAVPPASDEIAADEEYLFDPSGHVWALATDHESDMQPETDP